MSAAPTASARAGCLNSPRDWTPGVLFLRRDAVQRVVRPADVRSWPQGLRRGWHAVRAGEGSADQARDPGTGAGLLQDPRGPGAQTHLRDGQGRGRCQPRRGFGRPQRALAGFGHREGMRGPTEALDFPTHLEFLAARPRWSMPPRTDLDDLPPRQ